VTVRSDEAMLDKAIDLLAGAIVLHAAGNDHAALLLAIHSGINSADAINEFHGEPFSGDHRRAPEHLRKLDPERLSDAARWLRQLVDMKATAAYRQKRYTTRNTADAVANAERLLRISHARIESSIDIGERIRP
jgi:hypothetical protein